MYGSISVVGALTAEEIGILNSALSRDQTSGAYASRLEAKPLSRLSNLKALVSGPCTRRESATAVRLQEMSLVDCQGGARDVTVRRAQIEGPITRRGQAMQRGDFRHLKRNSIIVKANGAVAVFDL